MVGLGREVLAVVVLDRLLDLPEFSLVEPHSVAGGALVDLDVRLVLEGLEGRAVSGALHDGRV